ncbi:MAG: DUF779 domain-containing protein [Verrucomicrobiota bacterium]
MPLSRIDITEEAEDIIRRLELDHGPLMFHQSGGCCDGSSPMCYAKGSFRIGASDIWLGEVAGCDFFMSKSQFQVWEHTHLTLDVVEGRGASFSLEIPLGYRFLIRSRVFTDEEKADLMAVKSGKEYE